MKLVCTMAGDDAIYSDRFALDAGDGNLDVYGAWPTHSLAQTPSVVVVMHVWGIDPSMRDVVDRLAKTGFAAIVPNLYSRFDGVPNGEGATDSAPFRAFAGRLDPQRVQSDLLAAQRLLHDKFPRTRTAILGFCMGGRIALQCAAANPQSFDGVVSFYGAVNEVDPAALRVPVSGSYGADDRSIPASEVEAFAARLPEDSDVRIYEGAGHAFFDSRRASYAPGAALDAWTRTVEYLRGRLGEQTP